MKNKNFLENNSQNPATLQRNLILNNVPDYHNTLGSCCSYRT